MSEPQNPSELQDYVTQYSAAYDAHRATYALRVPPPERIPFDEPEPPLPRWTLENGGTLLLLALLVGASMVVSGSRTIPEFGDVGAPAFVMLEMGLITYAFIRTSRNYNAERHKTLGTWVSAGMYMAFAVLLAANLDAVLARQGVTLPDWVDLIIDALVAISAPVLALISGDVLGMYSVMQRQSRRKAQDDHASLVAEWKARRDAHDTAQRAELDAWRDGLNAAWNAAKKQLGVQLPARDPQPVHSVHSFALPAANEPANSSAAANKSNERRMNPANGYHKNMSAKDVAADYIRQHRASNPALMEMSTDELHALLLREAGAKIGRTTAHEARKLVAEEPLIDAATIHSAERTAEMVNGNHSE